MSEKVKQAISYCEKSGQRHLIDYLKPVFSAKADLLAREILKTDLPGINSIYSSIHNAQNKNDSSAKSENGNHNLIEPFDVVSLAEMSPEYRDLLELEGRKLIASGRVGAITMAGGQGTRLGHIGPKGTFLLPVEPPRSLFEIQCRRLKHIGKECASLIPWYIMTSHENHRETVDFFDSNDYFGYDKQFIKFFPQSMIPCVDMNGQILIRDNSIVTGADGNGGVFAALASSGMLEDMENMGIERLFVCGIDNALVKIADPVFLGFSVNTGMDIVSKSVVKRSWDEKAGVFCRVNGRPGYVEYTEISDEQAKARNKYGDYLFGDIGIVTYVYTTAMLRKLADKPLPYHPAHKKIPYSRPDGESIMPAKPNAIKFETFIFDSFKECENIAVLRVDRNEEFAPIKNATGEDSPEAFYLQTRGIIDIP